MIHFDTKKLSPENVIKLKSTPLNLKGNRKINIIINFDLNLIKSLFYEEIKTNIIITFLKLNFFYFLKYHHRKIITK